MPFRSPRLATTLCGIPLNNPVLAASGTFAYGVEFDTILDLNRLGGFVVKGLSKEPMDGNPAPRVWEAEAGMMNSIGLQNIGVRAFVSTKLPALAKLKTAVFANVFGYAARAGAAATLRDPNKRRFAERVTKAFQGAAGAPS